MTREQCDRNDCKENAKGSAFALPSIRRKSLVPKVGLEPTLTCVNRILSPKIGVFVELDLRFGCVESLVRTKI